MKNSFIVIVCFGLFSFGCAGNQAFRAMPQYQQQAWSRCYNDMLETNNGQAMPVAVMRPIMNRYIGASEEEKELILLQNGCRESIVRAFYQNSQH